MSGSAGVEDDVAKILIVDDHEPNILALEAILGAPGHEIIRAQSGAEALRQVLKHDFAVILLDVLMPVMDGFETARLIRSREASRATPIIFLTAAGSREDMVSTGYELGAVDYLIKPLNPRFVRAKVEVFVDLHRKNHRLRRQEEALRAAERDRHHSLLAGVSQILLRVLDREVVFSDVARFIASSFGDWCVIGTLSPDDNTTAEVCVAHWDPSLSAVADELGRKLADNPRFRQALHGGGHGAVISNVPEVMHEAWGADLETLGLVHRLGASGPVMTAPLSVRDQARGQVAFVSAHPSRRFGSMDTSTATDLADRIALGLENARLYHEAREAVRARDEFLSIASHELRTPITTLQIHVQRLLRGRAKDVPPLQERLRAILERCERQVRRLESLIDHLLDVSRVSAGGLKLEREPVDLAELVREVSTRFAEELAETESQLELEAIDSVPGVWDRLRLEQLVTNLLSNAIKYGNGKPITVRVRSTAAGGELEVRDRGQGIPAVELPRIFRKFQRALSARPSAGLGLGLYISRQIVDAHGGSIRVESEPDAGSVFAVELPSLPPDRSAPLLRNVLENQGRAVHGST